MSQDDRLVKIDFSKLNYGWGEYQIAEVEFVSRNDDYTCLGVPADDLIGLTIRPKPVSTQDRRPL